MAKRYCGIFLFCILMILSFSACSDIPIPYGKWESSTPDLTIDIDPALTGVSSYTGTYTTKSGTDVSTQIVFDTRYNVMDIYDPSSGKSYFSGSYRIEKDRLHYMLNVHTIEETGISTIDFELVEKYEE